MSVPSQRLVLVPAGVAVVQGIGLIGYAIVDVVQGIRVGITGPQEVSNLPGLILQIVIFAVLGIAMFLIAVGWWRVKYAARAPFIVAQLLALVVGVPLVGAPDTGTQQVGVVLIATAVVGLVVSLLPPITRALVESDG